MKRYEYAQSIIEAFNEGKTIQGRYNVHTWDDLNGNLDGIGIQNLNNKDLYRVKPEDTYREWTLADVPPVCWIRRKKDDKTEHLVTKRTDNYVYYQSAPNSTVFEFSVSYCSLFAYYEYKDNSGEWKPCKIKC